MIIVFDFNIIVLEDCEIMVQVCEGVDVLDCELVVLIVMWVKYMEVVVCIKFNCEVVWDEWCINDVIFKVIVEFEWVGLSISIFELVWCELVECLIVYEFMVWDKIWFQLVRVLNVVCVVLIICFS